MMKVTAINGSPRKNGSTARLLKAFETGAKEAGAGDVKLFDLADYEFRGCMSCYGCKKRDTGCGGRCVLDDAISGVLEEVRRSDVLIFGSPVYFHNISGLLKCFLERLLFPYHTEGVNAPGNTRAVLMCTMSQTEERYYERGYDRTLGITAGCIAKVFGSCELTGVFDTHHLIDYESYRIMTTEDVIRRKTDHYRNGFETEIKRLSGLGKAIVEEKFRAQ